MKKRQFRKVRSVKQETDYQVIWDMVDAAIRDTMQTHPEYFHMEGNSRANSIRISLNKRITGALVSKVREARQQSSKEGSHETG